MKLKKLFYKVGTTLLILVIILYNSAVNEDNKVTLLDYGLILAHVKRTKLLF